MWHKQGRAQSQAKDYSPLARHARDEGTGRETRQWREGKGGIERTTVVPLSFSQGGGKCPRKRLIDFPFDMTGDAPMVHPIETFGGVLL